MNKRTPQHDTPNNCHHNNSQMAAPGEFHVVKRFLAALLLIGISAGAAANVAPTVAITSPSVGAPFIAPVAITLRASAADSDGSIEKVEFYNGAALIGTATAAPYAVDWSAVAAGSYSVTAQATDNDGGVTVSAPVSVVVTDHVAPVVSVSATPTSAAAPAVINLSATATASDGAVVKVEFFSGTDLLATVTNAPYTFSWIGAASGTYAITARATDNLNVATTSAPVNVAVTGSLVQAYYIHSDHINTPRLITDQAGRTVWQMDQEAFATNLPNENPAGQGMFSYNQRFPGQYFDRETGLHYNYFRDYDPQTGRYVQSDPIGLSGGINTYSYVEGNPIGGIDPQGLQLVLPMTPPLTGTVNSGFIKPAYDPGRITPVSADPNRIPIIPGGIIPPQDFPGGISWPPKNDPQQCRIDVPPPKLPPPQKPDCDTIFQICRAAVKSASSNIFYKFTGDAGCLAAFAICKKVKDH